MISPGAHVGTTIEFVSVGSDGDSVAVSDPDHEIAQAWWIWIPAVNSTRGPLPWESVPVIVSPRVRVRAHEALMLSRSERFLEREKPLYKVKVSFSVVKGG